MTFIDLVHAKPIEKSSEQPQVSTIDFRVIYQAKFYTVFWQLCACAVQTIISPSTGIHIWQMISLLVTQAVILYLSELYFVLDHQSFVSIVVSFTLSLPSESHLVSLKVALILANFHKPHSEEEKLTISVPHRHGGLVALIGGKTGVSCTHLTLPLPSKSIVL